MKVVRPRVTDPLAFSGLDGGLIFFSGLFYLVMHSKINYKLLFKHAKTNLLGKRIMSRSFTCSARRFLPSVFRIQLLPSRLVHYSEKKTNGYTLSPATAPKCGAIKRVSFTSNYLTLICQSGSVLLFQRVSQSEAITCQSNASSTVFKKYKSKRMLK